MNNSSRDLIIKIILIIKSNKTNNNKQITIINKILINQCKNKVKIYKGKTKKQK